MRDTIFRAEFHVASTATKVHPTRASAARSRRCRGDFASAVSRASRMRLRISAKAIVGLGHNTATRPSFSRNTFSKRASCSAKPATSSSPNGKVAGIKFPVLFPRATSFWCAYATTRAYGGDIETRSRSVACFFVHLSLLSRAAVALTSDRHTQFPFKSQHSAQANVERPQTTWCRAAASCFRAGEISGFRSKASNDTLACVLRSSVSKYASTESKPHSFKLRGLATSSSAWLRRTPRTRRARAGPPFAPKSSPEPFSRGGLG
jgi:hypothetical protein